VSAAAAMPGGGSVRRRPLSRPPSVGELPDPPGRHADVLAGTADAPNAVRQVVCRARSDQRQRLLGGGFHGILLPRGFALALEPHAGAPGEGLARSKAPPSSKGSTSLFALATLRAGRRAVSFAVPSPRRLRFGLRPGGCAPSVRASSALRGRPRGRGRHAGGRAKASGLAASARHKATTVSHVGLFRPCSRDLTAAVVTPAASANCRCVQPRASRNSRKRPANHSAFMAPLPSNRAENVPPE